MGTQDRIKLTGIFAVFKSIRHPHHCHFSQYYENSSHVRLLQGVVAQLTTQQIFNSTSVSSHSHITSMTNKMTVWPEKTQISLGIRRVWSESSQWLKDPSFLHADSEDSDQTGRMPRLIRVFARPTIILLVLSWGGSNNFYSDSRSHPTADQVGQLSVTGESTCNQHWLSMA